MICPTGKAKKFLQEGWTGILQKCPTGKSDGGVAMAVQTGGPDQAELIDLKMRAAQSWGFGFAVTPLRRHIATSLRKRPVTKLPTPSLIALLLVQVACGSTAKVASWGGFSSKTTTWEGTHEIK
jgi:hypothetical protein